MEHQLQFTRRTADDLEHVGGGGLLLKRFAQLVHKPGVFDGDDGLIGKVGEQNDLTFVERANFLTEDDDDPNRLIVLEHRHCNGGASTTELDHRDALRMALRVGGCRGEIDCVGGPLGLERFAHWAARDRTERTLPSHFTEGRRQIVRCSCSKGLALA
jgi:hypothetical protein